MLVWRPTMLCCLLVFLHVSPSILAAPIKVGDIQADPLRAAAAWRT